MKKLLIIVMACYALNARSQVNESENFIRLYSDSTIYAQKVRLRPDFAGSWTVRADSRKVPINQIKFFNNDDGFFANTRKLNLFNQATFAERIVAGKINLYQEVAYSTTPYEMDFYRFRERTPQAVGTRMYYNKGYNDLKRVNYNNLSADMADNARSMDLLASYRKSRRAGTIMYVSAGAAIVASVVTLFSGNDIKRIDHGFGNMPSFEGGGNKTGSFLLLGLGAGLSVGGYLIQSSGSRNIERAVDTYNQ
jgi:hypothetical protein